PLVLPPVKAKPHSNLAFGPPLSAADRLSMSDPVATECVSWALHAPPRTRSCVSSGQAAKAPVELVVIGEFVSTVRIRGPTGLSEGRAASSSTAPCTVVPARCDDVLSYEICAALGVGQLQAPSGRTDMGVSEQLTPTMTNKRAMGSERLIGEILFRTEGRT